MNTTLVIIGSHPRTRANFDFNRTDADIWLFNEALSGKGESHAWAKRGDAVFQMHVPAIWRNPQNRNDPGHYKWLNTQKDVPIWMQEAYPEVPMAKAYPLQGVLDLLGGDPDHFLSSSVPQAMGLAAYLGCYKRIEIYGVAMETNTEWAHQREGVAFWKGFLMGRGIEVYFADPTFRVPIYGYEGEVAIAYEKFGERMAELQPEIERLGGIYQAATAGATHALTAFTLDASKENANALFAAVKAQVTAVQQLGLLDGMRQENARYKGKADTMREASGGEFVFSRQEFESAAKNMGEQAGSYHSQFIVLGTKLGLAQEAIARAAKGSAKRNKAAQGYAGLLAEYMKAANFGAIHKGASEENFRYMAILDKGIRAAGGYKAEPVLLEQAQNA